MQPTRPLVLVFCKNPVLGRVKTRLAATIGPEKALKAYQLLIAKTQRILQECSVPVAVWHHPAPLPDPDWESIATHRFAQVTGDLGQKMNHAFQWAFSSGYTQVIALGTDLWDLQYADLQQAFSALQNHSTVIGPATDGGYYLLGLSREMPELFRNKSWSQPNLLNETLIDLQGKSVFLLPKKNDLDTLQDLQEHPDLWEAIQSH